MWIASARVPDLTRLWLLPCTRAHSADVSLEPVRPARVAADAPISARYRLVFDRARGACELFDAAGLDEASTEQSGPPLMLDGEPPQSVFEALDELARRHAGEQVALSLDAELFAPLARRALGIQASAIARGAANFVVDWPTRVASHLRCAFIGLDLDWSPPPPAAIVARFPGGPGSAASSKS